MSDSLITFFSLKFKSRILLSFSLVIIPNIILLYKDNGMPVKITFNGYPFVDIKLKEKKITAKSCHTIIDGGKDGIGNDIVLAGEGTGIVHIATGCGDIDSKIGKKYKLVSIAPLNDEACYIDGFGDFTSTMIAIGKGKPTWANQTWVN